MNRLTRIGLFVAAVTAAAAAASAQQPPAAGAQAPPPPPAVKVGDPMPDFTLPYLEPLEGGKVERKEISLGSFKGRQNVVLAFFPAAFSPG
jgi:hypothetical protein